MASLLIGMSGRYNNQVSAFWLKITAFVTMIIDHLGLFFFPDILILRIIGRLSFPIFAWLIANGAIHTRNKFKYSGRLFAAALITQPIYYLANKQIGNTDIHLNIFFTLFLGLLTIFFIEKYKSFYIRALFICFAAFLSLQINADYGAMGILSIAFFYLFFNQKIYIVISQILIYSAWYLWILYEMVLAHQFSAERLAYFIQPLAVFSLVFILSYNGKEGKEMKSVFYLIYPAQYAVFYFVLRFLAQ